MDVKVSVKVSFVIPDGCTKQSECSENMHRAFEVKASTFLIIIQQNLKHL